VGLRGRYWVSIIANNARRPPKRPGGAAWSNFGSPTQGLLRASALDSVSIMRRLSAAGGFGFYEGDRMDLDSKGLFLSDHNGSACVVTGIGIRLGAISKTVPPMKDRKTKAGRDDVWQQP